VEQVQGPGAWVAAAMTARTPSCSKASAAGQRRGDPLIHTKVDRPAKFRMSVCTGRGRRPAGFSLIAVPRRRKSVHQLAHPGEVAGLEEGRVEATTADGVREFYFILRNHGVGKVFYDDFHTERE